MNGMAEVKGENDISVRKRNGITNLGAVKVGSPSLIIPFNGSILTLINSTVGGAAIYRQYGTISGTTYTQTASTSVISTTLLDDPTFPFTAAVNANGVTPLLFTNCKNRAFWIAGTFAVTQVVVGTCEWFNLGRKTVYGTLYLNGRWYVMDTTGTIWGSEEETPATWPALNFITSSQGQGNAVALQKSQSYVVAFKEYSTELFFDAGNATGSVLSPVENGFTKIGCAIGTSCASLDDQLFWMSQTIQSGRGVHVMVGLDQQKISTPDIDRILNADSLSTVYAYGIKMDGHRMYVLILVNTNMTLVYDLDSQLWYQWSSQDLGNSVSVTSITRSGTTATVTTSGAHGIADGAPAGISGAVQTEYNGNFQAKLISSTAYEIEVSGSPATPATGTILSFPYSEAYFKFVMGCNYQGRDVVLHHSTGSIYQFRNAEFDDSGAPIDFFMRTKRLDGGALNKKGLPRVTLIADSIADTCMIRYSDDDCASYTAYRRVNLSYERPVLRRNGSFRRRTTEVRFLHDKAAQFDSLELEVD